MSGGPVEGLRGRGGSDQRGCDRRGGDRRIGDQGGSLYQPVE